MHTVLALTATATVRTATSIADNLRLPAGEETQL